MRAALVVPHAVPPAGVLAALLAVPLALLCGGCVPLSRQPAGPPAFTPPTTSVTYAGATTDEDPDYYQAGPYDLYRLSWAPGTSVRLTLSSPAHDTLLNVSCPRQQDQRVAARAGQPAVLEWVLGPTPGECRVIVASTRLNVDGDYTLQVGPPPTTEVSLPKPPPTLAQRRERVLSRQAAKTAFLLSAKDRAIMLRSKLEGLEPIEKPLAQTLERFDPVPLTVEPGFCYAVSWELGAGAAWSELAKRGVEWWALVGSGRANVNSNVLGAGGITERYCPKEAGTVSLVMEASSAPRGLEKELGTGPVTLRFHRMPLWPGKKSPQSLKAEQAKVTRGTAVVLSRVVSLDGPIALEVPFAANKCAAVTLTLTPGSAWSAKVIEHGIGFNYDLPGSDLSAGPGLIGPGALSDVGCPGVTAKVPMEVVAYGGEQALGTGTATLQLRQRAARAGEVSRERREQRESARESQENSDRLKREHCSQCRRESRGDPDDFDRCVRRWLSSGDCD